MKLKNSVIAIAAILILITGAGILISMRVKTQVSELFKMNKELQEDGYYMADFEFQMLGFGYYLNKGQYIKAVLKLSDYYTKLDDRRGVTKIPEFHNNQEEINFYLNLQNPKTGAFIDDAAPFCTYWSITENILLHLEALTDTSIAPLKLKYPLTFLDEINTPEKLVAYLNDISYVGWPASRFPQTTFHFARDILSNAEADNIIGRNHLYSFSPEWKHTMLKWMHEFQDEKSGLWGSKDKKTNKLTKFDISNTYSIVKKYKDTNGDDIYEAFPLKYEERLFESALEQLSEPMPGDDELDKVHEWNLGQVKGIKMLLSRLWKGASEENKETAKRIITNFIEVSFDKYYVEKEGAFSYYPDADHASLDGSSVLMYDDIGAYSSKKQERLWGTPLVNARDLGVITLNQFVPSDFDSIATIPDINSIRVYITSPDYEKLTENVWSVIYPNTTTVLDVMELVPRMIQWIDSASLSMGNWVTMKEIKNEFSSLDIKMPLIYKNYIPMENMNRKIKEMSELYMIGYDKLQIPRFRVHYKYLKSI